MPQFTSTKDVSWSRIITVEPVTDETAAMVLPNTEFAAVIRTSGVATDILAICATSTAQLPMLWRHARRAAATWHAEYQPSADELVALAGPLCGYHDAHCPPELIGDHDRLDRGVETTWMRAAA